MIQKRHLPAETQIEAAKTGISYFAPLSGDALRAAK
jgi:hypothetical protein